MHAAPHHGQAMTNFTGELPPEHWQRDLDELTVAWTDQPTVIEILGQHIGAQTEERGLRLRSLSYDPHTDEFEATVVTGRGGHEDDVRHVVSHPTRITVDAAAGVVPDAVAIPSAEGTVTFVRRVGVNRQ